MLKHNLVLSNNCVLNLKEFWNIIESRTPNPGPPSLLNLKEFGHFRALGVRNWANLGVQAYWIWRILDIFELSGSGTEQIWGSKPIEFVRFGTSSSRDPELSKFGRSKPIEFQWFETFLVTKCEREWKCYRARDWVIRLYNCDNQALGTSRRNFRIIYQSNSALENNEVLIVLVLSLSMQYRFETSVIFEEKLKNKCAIPPKIWKSIQFSELSS